LVHHFSPNQTTAMHSRPNCSSSRPLCQEITASRRCYFHETVVQVVDALQPT
jgi:hypothetical protein